jgi:hypothetical protein
MYRSSMKKEEVPIALRHPIGEFQEGETPYLSGAQQTFLERIGSLPLVRLSVNRVRTIYENTKERNGLLRSALERGENSVAYSLNRAADVLTKTGITSRLQKPLELADSSACLVLDKFEDKLPIITKSPREIKLMFAEKVDARIEQIQNAKECTAEKVRSYRRWGTQTINDVKQLGADKVQAVLETPYGQTINQVIGYGLNSVDSAVEKYLPEGHSHKNGNLTNGNATSNGNGFHAGNLEHMKYISTKLSRRLSAKSQDVVDAVKQTSAASSLQKSINYIRSSAEVAQKYIRSSTEVAEKQLQKGRQLVASTAENLYRSAVEGFCKLVDLSHAVLLKLLPNRYHEQVNLMLDKSVSVLVKNGKNGHQD